MATASRASSPVSSGGTPKPLLLESKFEAQLAALESSDDEASPSKKVTNGKSTNHLDLSQQPIQNEDASEESEEDTSRPRGKFAARMLGATRTAKDGNASNQNETALDRVRKSLLEQEDKENNVDMPDAQSEDDDTPVARRRVVRKAPSSPIARNTSRGVSPSLFLSPLRPSPSKSIHNHSDSEDDIPALKPDRFKAMTDRYRKKRQAEDAAKEAKQAEKRAQQEELTQELEEMVSDDGSGITDDEGGRRLTQTDRPSARKASKKAIEEMNRETQRMSRNMYLTHAAKTRKKISKNSLFERFNFRPAGEPQLKVASSSRGPTPHSDVEMQDADTPPSSPPGSKEAAETTEVPAAIAENDDFDLPTIDTLTVTTKLTLDKGKGKAVETPNEQEQPAQKPKRQFRVIPPVQANATMLDSDDELEITTTSKDKVRAVFDMAPTKKAQEHSSVQTLRALAQVKSPGKDARRKNENHGMTAGELQTYLQQKARQQAKVERDRRLELLKAQGHVIQTAEDREREIEEADNMFARAKEEAHKLMQQERAADKKEKKANGEADPLAWDDSDDEEYQASGDEADGEVSAVELSGSEDEDAESAEEEAEGNPMIEGEAQDGESEVSADEDGDSSHVASQDVNDDAEEIPAMRRRRTRKPVLSDDDEEDDAVKMTPKPKTTTVHMSPMVPNTQSPIAPRSVLRSAKKNFIPGLPVQGAAGLGLTQIFAGTMDDSQMDSANGPTQSMMPDFDHFPDSNFSATMDEPIEDMVLDSQNDDTQKTTQGIKLDFSQSQMRGLDSLLRQESTQISDMIDFTQDEGLQTQTPLKDRFIEAPISTVETMVADPEDPTQASPPVRRGRLRRKMEMPQRIEETPEPLSTDKPDTAFNALREGAKKEKKKRLQAEFDYKNSKAKEMVQEQAEESEDEYAGLGGVDGEDSDNESTASLKDIIDDDAGNDVDEAKLAGFYA
jgi:mediator of replication checkpoint protein 1